MNALKRRGAALLLALLLALGLAGCGGKAPEPAEDYAPTDAPEPAEDYVPTEAPEDREPYTQDAAGGSGQDFAPQPEGTPIYTFADGVLTCSGGGKVSFYDEGVTDIIANAISSYDEVEVRAAVEKVVVEEGVTTLNFGAFEDLGNLKEVSLPNSLTRIDARAFDDTSLTSIRIPDSVTVIDDEAFAGCISLSSVTLPKGLDKISMGLFRYCENLTSIEIPDGVTSIEGEAFAASGLTELDLPESVTKLGYQMIMETQIKRIEVPAGATVLTNAFLGCHTLTEIVLHSDIPLGEIDGVLADPMYDTIVTGTKLTVYAPGGGNVEEWMNQQISETGLDCKFVANK